MKAEFRQTRSISTKINRLMNGSISKGQGGKIAGINPEIRVEFRRAKITVRVLLGAITGM